MPPTSKPPQPSEWDDHKAASRKETSIVEAYWYCKRSVDEVIRYFSSVFSDETRLNRMAIHRVVSKFYNHGTVLDRHRGNSGRRSRSSTRDNVDPVEEFISENPSSSIRRGSQTLRISRSSLQQLTDYDMQRRLKFASHMSHLFDRQVLKSERIWFRVKPISGCLCTSTKKNHRSCCTTRNTPIGISYNLRPGKTRF